MDCNKEEAVRAKEIAEKKMEDKDFVSARKFATRAQRLSVDIKDIPQMILVCDVHIAAQNKIYSGENDWYCILQIEPTADETMVKKQYRKLALLLHPDKNQFAGATDAFKLIGEAQKVLIDHQRRMMYDNKYRVSRKSQVSTQKSTTTSQPSSRVAHPWLQSNIAGNAVASKPMNPQQGQKDLDRETFWTVCPFCSVKYEYYMEVVNKSLSCKNCNKKFTGFEANRPINSPATSSKTMQKNEHVKKKGQPSTVPQTTFQWCSSNPTNVGTKIFESVNIGFPHKKPERQSDKKRVRRDNIRKTNVKTGKNRKKKKNKSAGSSSDNCDDSTDSSSNREEADKDSCEELNDNDDQVEQKSRHVRRSSRSKQKVSYDDYPSDDEYGKPSKNFKSDDDDDDDDDGVDATTSLAGDYVVQDPDFNSFDSVRTLDKFKIGQIWALYSDEDALPKYYGFIKKIDSPPNFRLHMSWLTSKNSEGIIQWVDKNMPVSCGKFEILRKMSQKYNNSSPFSHQIKVLPSKEKGFYDIIPQKGDVWGLYKGWNENIPYKELELCEYEVVEVVETVSKSSITVLILEHVKGYKSVFKPQKRGESDGGLTMEIPWAEMLRFSHQIPVIRLSEEDDGRLRGFWELDTAALPVYHFL